MPMPGRSPRRPSPSAIPPRATIPAPLSSALGVGRARARRPRRAGPLLPWARRHHPVRALPAAARRARRVGHGRGAAAAARPAFAGMQRRAAGAVRSCASAAARPKCDVEITELDFALRATPADAPPPYLDAPPAPLPRGTIALCYGAGDWDPARCVPAGAARASLPPRPLRDADARADPPRRAQPRRLPIRHGEHGDRSSPVRSW